MKSASALLILGLLTAGTLTACGGKTPETQPSTETTTPTAEAQSPAAEQPTAQPAASPAASPASGSAAPATKASHEVGEEHPHGVGPHGGVVKSAGGGHLELVVKGRDLKVYALDSEDKAMPITGVSGAQAILQPKGAAAQTLALMPHEDHLMTTLPAGVTAFTAIVRVPLAAGQNRSARFTVGMDGHTDHAH